MKKLKYPEYINGVKQVQNPIKRLFIKLFYSDWFRLFFIIIPFWVFVPLALTAIYLPEYVEIVRLFINITYIVLLIIGLTFNDYSNLRRIGLDEYHNPLVNLEDNKNV